MGKPKSETSQSCRKPTKKLRWSLAPSPEETVSSLSRCPELPALPELRCPGLPALPPVLPGLILEDRSASGLVNRKARFGTVGGATVLLIVPKRRIAEGSFITMSLILTTSHPLTLILTTWIPWGPGPRQVLDKRRSNGLIRHFDI